MMVSTGPMGVAMCQLIFRRITDFCNFDIKRQIHASEWMITVEGNVRLGDVGDRNNRRVGILPGAETITCFDTPGGHFLQGDLDDIAWILFTIAVLCLDDYVFLFADFHAAQFGFEPGDDLPGAFEERQRFATRRRVQGLAGCIGQKVMERNDSFAHSRTFLCFGMRGTLRRINAFVEEENEEFTLEVKPGQQRMLVEQASRR